MSRIPKNSRLLAALIKNGEIVCCPTDTVYGLIGSALRSDVFEKIYLLKKRNPKKPLIILFDSAQRARRFGVVLPKRLDKYLPARVTLVCPLEPFSLLRSVVKRSDVAVRIPTSEFLRKAIMFSEPVFAPSANIEGEPPSRDCKDCAKYFGGKVNFCVEGNFSENSSEDLPSTILDISNKIILREGADRELAVRILNECDKINSYSGGKRKS